MAKVKETFIFLQDVFDEVMALFPSEYIHIGGDEVHMTRWERCHACQTRIKEEGLADEVALQDYFTNRIVSYINSKGKKAIGWDDLLTETTNKNTIIMSWRGTVGGTEAAQRGHQAIMTPNQFLYLDMAQNKISQEPLAQSGGPNGRYINIEKVYNYDPMPETLTEEQKKYIIGVQACLWTEYVPNTKHAEYMLFPRVTALSETAWSNPEKKNYKQFSKRLIELQKRYDLMELNYCK